MAKDSSKKTVALSDTAILKEMSNALVKDKNIIPSDKKLAQEAIDSFKKGKINDADFINKIIYADSISLLEGAEKKGATVDWKSVKHPSIMNANDIPVLVKRGYNPNQPQDVGGERPYSLPEYSIVLVDNWVKINDEQDARGVAHNKASIAIQKEALVISKEDDEIQAVISKIVDEINKYDTQKNSAKKETRDAKADRLLAEFRKYEGKENLTPEEKEKLALAKKADAALLKSEELTKKIWEKTDELNASDEKMVKAMEESSQTFKNITATREICQSAKKSGALDAENTQKADALINFVNDYETEKRALYSGKTIEEIKKFDSENAKKGKGKGKANPKTAYMDRINNSKELMASLTTGYKFEKNGISSRLADASLSDDSFKEPALAANQPGKSSVLAQNGQPVLLTEIDSQTTTISQKSGSSLA